MLFQPVRASTVRAITHSHLRHATHTTARTGLACALAGTLLGSLFLLRSSRRPD